MSDYFQVRTISSFRPLVIKPGRASVQTTFQFAAQIISRRGEKSEIVANESRRVILDWLRGKYPEPIPPDAYRGEMFECDEHSQRISCIPIPEEGVWTVRLEQPDAPFFNRPAVPGRFWTTDIALRQQADLMLFAVRIQCASLSYANDPITITRPRVVLDLAERFILRETYDVNGRPWALERSEDLVLFESFLLNPLRNMPVILLTQPERHELHMGVSEFLLNHEKLAKQLQGFGYVATLPKNLAFEWTDRVGKQWSAFRGAVRTYMPGLDYEQHTPSMHPLTFPEKVLLWRYLDVEGEHQGEEGFERFLVQKNREHAATKRMDWYGCIFVPEARPLRAAMARKHTQDIVEWQGLYEIEIEGLKEQLQEASEEANTALSLAERAEKERDYFREENARLRAHNETLRLTLSSRTGQIDVFDSPLPNTYLDLMEWAEQSFVGRLELHPRAVRGLKKAVYEDIGLVCTALQLLARDYRNMRIGHDGAKEIWEAGLREFGLECSGAITENRAGEEGDTYFVSYPPNSNETHFMEFHLRKGTSRDERHCLRIYFFWHEETQQVVVAWLPSHLATRAT